MTRNQRRTPYFWGKLAERGLLERPQEITQAARELNEHIGTILRFLYEVEKNADQGKLAMFPTTRSLIERSQNTLLELSHRLHSDSIKQYNGPITP